MKRKQLKFCDVCGVVMKYLGSYKNLSGARFRTYQCPLCKGKIDFAQVKIGDLKGEFSVHSNVVPKEAKEK